MKFIKTHNKALQLTSKSGALLAFGSTELNRYVYKNHAVEITKDSKLRNTFIKTTVIFSLIFTTSVNARYCLEEMKCTDNDLKWLIPDVIVKGKNIELCKSFLTLDFDYIKFKEKHFVSFNDARTEVHQTVSGDGSGYARKNSGYFDINNDGINENIIQLELASGAGKGCDREYFAVLNSDKTDINNNKLNNLLRSFEGCSLRLRPFIYMNKTLLEDRGETYKNHNYGFWRVLSKIWKLTENEKELLCEYQHTDPSEGELIDDRFFYEPE